jgi:predicted cupin superfamily sugar epimerase
LWLPLVPFLTSGADIWHYSVADIWHYRIGAGIRLVLHGKVGKTENKKLKIAIGKIKMSGFILQEQSTISNTL